MGAGAHRPQRTMVGATWATVYTVSMRVLLLAAIVAACGCGPSTQAEGIPEYGYEIVHTYPHDTLAFTEGLFFLNGVLYESTGLNGQSSVRKVKFETGEVLQRHD